jgi:hypothetical protein
VGAVEAVVGVGVLTGIFVCELCSEFVAWQFVYELHQEHSSVG